MQVLFLDESGDHNLARISPQYPMFVLGGIVTDWDYANGPLTQALNSFKQDIFGRTDLILHTADITRNRRGFECLKDTVYRNRFYRGLNELMRELQYSVIACAVHKDNHLQRYGLAALDPYLLSLDILVERFCFALTPDLPGLIIAEKRDPILDQQLDLAWLNLKIQGTHFLKAREINARVSDFTLRDKQENLAGLQLADLVVSPMGRHVLGKPDREDWQIVESKLRRSSNGQTEGYGLVVLPK